MPNIGPLELAIVLIIALVIFGPKRLPELGRSLGNGMKEFRSSVSGVGKDDDDDEDPPEIDNEVEITDEELPDEPDVETESASQSSS